MDIADRLPLFPLIIAFIVYPIFAWIVLRWSTGSLKMRLFALLNIAGALTIGFVSAAKGLRLRLLPQYVEIVLLMFAIYVLVVLFNYVLLRRCRSSEGNWTALAFLFPIFILAAVKYLPSSWNPLSKVIAPLGKTQLSEFFIGISYVTFRLTRLVLEVRNEQVEMPGIWEYLAFAFFVPTISVGPINTYSLFSSSLNNPSRKVTPLGSSLSRIVIGFTKYIFLATLLSQFSYAGLLLDGHPHAKIDLVLALLAYPLYLYCNFSGFCDIAIGVSGLLGIEVSENFDRPFLARDLAEFWNRWHMTLSTWLRDLMFTPLSKALIRKFGSKYTNHLIAFSVCVVFLAIGIWHGNGLNYLLFGLSQGVGLAAVHYYTQFLRKRLGKKGYAAYNANMPLRWFASAVTFVYFAMSLFLFANSWQNIHTIFKVVS